MSQIGIKVDTSAVNKVLDALDKRRNTRQLLDNIGSAMRADARLNFRASAAPDGTPWAPLKHRTGKPLVDTGILRNSIDYRVIGDTAVEIGTNVIYARAQQYGRKEINLPARQFIGIADRQVNKINKLLKAWGDELMAGL